MGRAMRVGMNSVHPLCLPVLGFVRYSIEIEPLTGPEPSGECRLED
jgi:hypothetical protein